MELGVKNRWFGEQKEEIKYSAWKEREDVRAKIWGKTTTI